MGLVKLRGTSLDKFWYQFINSLVRTRRLWSHTQDYQSYILRYNKLVYLVCSNSSDYNNIEGMNGRKAIKEAELHYHHTL